MNILSILGTAGKFLFGGGSSGQSPAQTIAGAVDEYKYTEQEQAEDEKQGVADARKYEPSHMPAVAPIQQQGLIQFVLEFLLRLINQLTDSIIHLVRPWVTIELLGGLFGYWKLPELGALDPAYVKMIDVVLVFWFGARVITKDLPAMIAAFAAMKKK